MHIFENITDFILSIAIIFLISLIYFGQKQDLLIQSIASLDTADFMNEIKSKGYLDAEAYEEFLEELSHTGLLYDISFEHKQKTFEPEYRFRTAEEIIDIQNNAYTGLNTYHNYSVTTEIPKVTDPIDNSGLIMNTETNESILAKAVNTPSSGHTHTDACYAGHRHTSDCVPAGDMTTLVYVQGSHVAGGSNGVWNTFYIYCAKCGKMIAYYDFYYNMDATNGGRTSRIQTVIYHYTATGAIDTINQSVSVWSGSTNYWDIAGLSATLGNNMWMKLINTPASYLPTVYTYTSPPFKYTDSYFYYDYTGAYHTYPYVGCVYCGTYGANYSCGLKQDETLICNQVVTGIAATNPSQVVYTGENIITTETATYMDGSTNVIVCTADFTTDTPVSGAAVVLTYTDARGNKLTAPITVTVIPKTKTCVNGHVYNIQSDGTDPGCPFCKAWLSSLVTEYPAAGNLVIYRGTSLPDNGVTLLATYMDGHTELVTSEYADNLDKLYVGSQNVTISYKGLYTSLKVIVKRNLVLCPECNKYYELYPDDSDPGCPYCASKTPIFTGNVMEYYTMRYTEDVLKEIYEGSGTYYFINGDYLTIKVKNSSSSVGSRLLAHIYKGFGESNINIADGGYIREDGYLYKQN